ncbi:hypothetical protein ES703_105624 [subsurface metagenome]
MPRISASKVKSYWKKYGTLRLVKKVLSRVCSFFFSYHVHNFYGISVLPRTQLRPRCSLEIRKGSPEDTNLMVKMLDYMDQTTVRKQQRRLFDNGGKVFLAFSEGKLVHIGWLFCSPLIHEPSFSVRINQDEAYIGRCDTHPDFRGKNIYPAVLQHIITHAVGKNRKRCFVATIPTNLASIRGIEKAGFSFVGKMRMFKLFGKFFNNLWSSSDIILP